MYQKTFKLGELFTLVADISSNAAVEADILDNKGKKVAYLHGFGAAAWAIEQRDISFYPVYDNKFKEARIDILDSKGQRMSCLASPAAMKESLILKIFESIADAQ
jgi:hypothetical protein